MFAHLPHLQAHQKANVATWQGLNVTVVSSGFLSLYEWMDISKLSDV